MNKKFMLLLPIVASLMLAGCGKTSSATPDSSSSTESSSVPAATITAVTIASAGDVKTIALGGTLQLTATVTGTGDFGKNVTWDTSDKAIATVAGGLVTGVAVGDVTITATSKDDATKKGTISLSVKEVITSIKDIKAQDTYTVKGVVIAKDLSDVIISDGTAAINLYFAVTTDIGNYAVGDYLQVKGTTYDYYGIWQFYAAVKTTDTDHVAVAITKLTETAPTIPSDPVELTTAIIDAHKASPSDWGLTAMKYVKLTQSKLTITPVTGKTYSNYSFYVGSYEVRLHSLDTTVFASLVSGSYYDVVAVDFGYNSGNSYQNIVATKITLAATPSGIVEITSAGAVTTLDEKATLQLTATETGIADATFTWTADPTTVATVDAATGLVTGVKAGDVTITATANDTHTATFKLTVKSLVTALPLTGKFAGSIPDGWTYIPNNSSYPTPAFYGTAGLKMNFENMGATSPSLTVAVSAINVTLNIAALNENSKTAGTADHVFTITGLNAKGETAASGYLDALVAGDNTVVSLTGTDIVAVKVLMTKYFNNGTKCVNVSLASITLTAPTA